MEIKDKLNKPYTEKQRLDFIVKNNHKLGYEIQETDDALLAIYKEPEAPTYEEQKQACISELKQFLENTDYISCKLIEAIDEAELQDLKEKYKDVLKQRREARAEINSLEMSNK